VPGTVFDCARKLGRLTAAVIAMPRSCRTPISTQLKAGGGKRHQMLASSEKGLNNHEARIIVSSTNFFLVFGRAIVYVHLNTIRAAPGIKQQQ
jgi:hypothetical protein